MKTEIVLAGMGTEDTEIGFLLMNVDNMSNRVFITIKDMTADGLTDEKVAVVMLDDLKKIVNKLAC